MNMFFKKFFLLLFFVKLSYGNIDYSKWMEQFASEIENIPLNKLVIAGTHDTGTYSMSYKSSLAKDGNLPPWLKYFKYLGIPNKVIADWGRTQNKTVLEQLKAGVRYLDLRITYSPTKKDFYTCHALYSEGVTSIINQISKFINENPKEIIIIDCQHLYNMNQKGVDKNEDLVKRFIDAFGNKIALKTTLKPSSKIKDFWDHEAQIIILYDNRKTVQTNDKIWSRSNIISAWPNKQKLKDLIDFLKHELDDHQHSTYNHNKFFVVQGILTADSQVIKNSFKFWTKDPRNLEKMAEKVTPEIAKFIKENRQNNKITNIYISDFITEEFVKNAIEANLPNS